MPSCVCERQDPYNGAVAGHSEWLPIKIIWSDVRLGEDDERDWLVASDEPELVW